LLAELHAGPVNYPKVKSLKWALLHTAFESFSSAISISKRRAPAEFRAFMQENAEWLSDYALFRVLMEENGSFARVDRWSPEHRGPRRARTWLLSLGRDAPATS